MMFNKRSLLSLSTIFIIAVSSFHAIGQEIPTNIHGKKMKTFIDLEKKLGGKPYQPEGDIIISNEWGFPLIYRRTEKDIPDLVVTYNFGKQDSLMHSIEYEWDMTKFDLKQETQPLNIQKAFIKKYLSLVKQLDQKIGKSEQKGDLDDLAKIDLKGGLSRSDVWKPNDTTYISLYAIFSNYQEEKGNVKIRPTNRIRLGISKMKKPAPELSDKAVMAAKQTFEQFIIKLRAGDFEGAKAHLATQTRAQLTETIFNQLKASIKPENFKIYYKALQPIDGANYLAIQFAYENAPAQPKELFMAVFNKEGLILGIRPMIRQE